MSPPFHYPSTLAVVEGQLNDVLYELNINPQDTAPTIPTVAAGRGRAPVEPSLRDVTHGGPGWGPGCGPDRSSSTPAAAAASTTSQLATLQECRETVAKKIKQREALLAPLYLQVIVLENEDEGCILTFLRLTYPTPSQPNRANQIPFIHPNPPPPPPPLMSR